MLVEHSLEGKLQVHKCEFHYVDWRVCNSSRGVDCQAVSVYLQVTVMCICKYVHRKLLQLQCIGVFAK